MTDDKWQILTKAASLASFVIIVHLSSAILSRAKVAARVSEQAASESL